MSAYRTMVDTDEQPDPSEYWCCGMIQSPDKMVHLGNHPEVSLCVRCAYSVKTWAWEIEDRGKTGPGVKSREAVRLIRQSVTHRNLHEDRWVGRPLRWLGRRLP